MYQTIVIALDATPGDRAIIEHIKSLAKLLNSRVVLLHVADGWSARLRGPDAISPEIQSDREYLQTIAAEFGAEGISAEAELEFGDPATEITRWVEENECDLLAMGTHGHRFLADIFLGSTADPVRHNVSVPVLLLRAAPPSGASA